MSEQVTFKNTLFLVQASYATTPLALQKMHRLYSQGDKIVLMGESIMHATHALLQTIEKCYVLENEQQLLNPIPDNIQLVNYDEFATISLQYTRCISLK